MLNSIKMETQLDNEQWHDYQEKLQELEKEALTYTLNKSYNRKGLTLSDYNNSDLY